MVTIGIPTFQRPELLERALSAVDAQEYPNLEVLIADNASIGDDVLGVVDGFRNRLERLTYFRHEHTLPVVSNYLFLLQRASGIYFMWLADDDELSSNYVSGLVEILEANDGAATAAGNWMLMLSPNHGRRMRASNYPQLSPGVRAVRYIWRTDDAFFYALHRTSILREASFPGYWWPNRGAVKNWGFVFLLDVVLRGRVLLAEDPSIQFINHNYTPKSYLTARDAPRDALGYLGRRVNVHLIYWQKCARVLAPAWMPVVIVTSIVSLMREGLMKALRTGRRS